MSMPENAAYLRAKVGEDVTDIWLGSLHVEEGSPGTSSMTLTIESPSSEQLEAIGYCVDDEPEPSRIVLPRELRITGSNYYFDGFQEPGGGEVTELPEDEEGDFGYDPKDKEEFLLNRAALLDTGFRIIERVARREPVISAHWDLDETSGRGGRPDNLHKIRHGNFGFPDLSDDVYTDYVVPEGTRYYTINLRETDNRNSAPLFILLPVQPDGLPARSGPIFGRSPKRDLVPG